VLDGRSTSPGRGRDRFALDSGDPRG
jgi:hypothetical protein